MSIQVFACLGESALSRGDETVVDEGTPVRSTSLLACTNLVFALRGAMSP